MTASKRRKKKNQSQREEREAESQVTLPLTTDTEAHVGAHIAAASLHQPGSRSVPALLIIMEVNRQWKRDP